MRLWHKDLISVLPDKQLLRQWRECCMIAKALRDGNLNHLLVNKVKDYPLTHFAIYGFKVFDEMKARGFVGKLETFTKYLPEWFNLDDVPADENGDVTDKGIFPYWHNERYFWQCYRNLQEKYDCGGMSEKEWQRIEACGNERLK